MSQLAAGEGISSIPKQGNLCQSAGWVKTIGGYSHILYSSTAALKRVLDGIRLTWSNPLCSLLLCTGTNLLSRIGNGNKTE
ncbi:hypothetical protein F9C07_6871 [Aspergillus flavus]|uniref:Uncharacterized protein n=1 Tax=Aspergillus flavus (strain ATCC 200026 / FGSC A1120 / IAM 13836 / NRRL 3357 / JCM 12722 / SRRC 167) TaxID=332952 RepID=A0A7U2MH04_ASPFN|nr:hypothetical protein F9C07_6871 [Aspergillus flavus]